jgi:hypothetical protein
MRPFLYAFLVPALYAAQPPVLKVDNPHHDFGRIGADAKVVHRFKISNASPKGGENLNISRLNPSCGCTSTVIGQWTLAPGESTDVEASFNPSGFKGLVHKTIQVVSNDPATPTFNLTFEAEVVREITSSTETVFFQEIRRNESRKSSVKLTSGTDKPVHVTDVSAPGAKHLSFKVRPDDAAKAAWVDVTLDGNALPASQPMGTDAIVVRTDNPRVPLINLTVQWEVRNTLRTDPVRVVWAEPGGHELRQKLTVNHVDGKPFRILSYRSTNPLIRVEGLNQAPGAAQVLQVVLDGKAKPGLYNEKVALVTDCIDQKEIEFRVAASLRDKQ